MMRSSSPYAGEERGLRLQRNEGGALPHLARWLRHYVDEYLLADAEVGFVEDEFGAAILSPLIYEDEALVVLEVDAVGFAPVIVEVPVSWHDPDVFVEVPFF